jgi:perosamine synthetase
MNEIRQVASEYNITVIEDAAEAIFSKYEGKYAGCMGDLGCFSFHAAKTITTGEGGMVVTNNQDLAERVRLLRNHGMSPKRRYWHELIGLNYRLTDLQAAIGCAQLEGVDGVIQKRRELYLFYKELLSKIPGVEFQQITEGVEPVYWGMPVKLQSTSFPEGRDPVLKHMESAGVEVRPGFYPFSKMPPYESPSLPVAEELGRQILCLPFHTLLQHSEIEYICNCLKSLVRE